MWRRGLCYIWIYQLSRLQNLLELGYFVFTSVCTVDWLLQIELSYKWSWGNSSLSVFHIKHVTKLTGELEDRELQVSQTKPHCRWLHNEIMLVLRTGLLCCQLRANAWVVVAWVWTAEETIALWLYHLMLPDEKGRRMEGERWMFW